MFDLKTYVVHCKQLPDRKVSILKQFARHNFTNFEFFEDFDAFELSPETISRFYRDNPKEERAKYNRWFPENQPRSLKLTDISVTIKYCEIYKQIAEGNDEHALILEDDSVLVDNFVDRFNDLYSRTPQEYDILFLASCCNLYADEDVSKKDHPATRCLGATVIKKSLCKKLVETIIPFHLCADWEMNYQLWLHDSAAYWWDPIVSQGSETGLFKTSMR